MAKVVVIDDMKVMRLFMRRVLEKLGHAVIEWEPPAATEIVERLQAEAPDLVITDYQMPGCNGATIARMAKRARKDLPVIVLTSMRDEDLESSCLKQGADLVLHKPVTVDLLEREVERFLTRGVDGTVRIGKQGLPV
jgi:CheY-like chemotaxis protein